MIKVFTKKPETILYNDLGKLETIMKRNEKKYPKLRKVSLKWITQILEFRRDVLSDTGFSIPFEALGFIMTLTASEDGQGSVLVKFILKLKKQMKKEGVGEPDLLMETICKLYQKRLGSTPFFVEDLDERSRKREQFMR